MKPQDKSIIDEVEISSSHYQVDHSKKSLKSSIFEKLHITEKNVFSFLVRSIFMLFFSSFFFVAAIYYGFINP